MQSAAQLNLQTAGEDSSDSDSDSDANFDLVVCGKCKKEFKKSVTKIAPNSLHLMNEGHCLLAMGDPFLACLK